jgi:hypothetical protein
LLDKLLEALDGILGRRLFLNQELDRASGDTAGGIEFFHRPLGGPEAADAGAGRDARARGENAELAGFGLGHGRGAEA